MRVAVRVLPPFVVREGDTYSGFSIELWNEIARRIGVESTFVPATDVHAQLAAVKSGAADVGVGAVSITAERNQQFDFSQPILNAGMQILVRSERAGAESTALASLLHLLFSPAVLTWLGIAIVLTIIPAHIVWFMERNHEGGIITSKTYYPGILQAFYWGLGALATQADSMPRQWLARIVAVLWMFTGVVFVAFYTAQLTATLTVEQFKSEISGPQDLPGKKVATTAGSTSADYLQTLGVAPVTFEGIDGAIEALKKKEVDAVVFDAPVLQYYATHIEQGRVRTVGPLFHNEYYGYALQNGSLLRKRIDDALLSMREDGSYQDLVDKWFGAK